MNLKVFSNSVTDVVSNIEKYNNNKTISINGKVKYSYSLLGKCYFSLQDENNTINCIANDFSPTPNSDIIVKGKLSITYRLNSVTGLLFIVDEK